MKKIANIVFYKFNGEKPSIKQACIFYTDGTVNNVPYEEGLDACQEIVQANNIKSRAEFKELINNRLVYVMSGRDFEERFQTFISREDVDNQNSNESQVIGEKAYQKALTPGQNNAIQIKNNNLNNMPSIETPRNVTGVIDDVMEKQEPSENPLKPNTNDYDNNIIEPKATIEDYTTDSNVETPVVENQDDKNNDRKAKIERPVIIPASHQKENEGTTGTNNEEERFVNESHESTVIPPVMKPERSKTTPIEDEGLEDEDLAEDSYVMGDESHEVPVVAAPTDDLDDLSIDEEPLTDGKDIEDVDAIDADIEDDVEMAKGKPKKENRFVAWIKRGVEKIKNMKLVKKITAVVLALAVGLGLYSCHAKQTKSGQMLNSNIPSNSQDYNDGIANKGGHLFLIHGNNDHYNDYSFEELQKVTTAEAQKTSMANVAATLKGFNGDFAAAHVEEGKDIKAALTFDEVVALQQAYNNYSNEEIRAIFNGASIRSDEMSRAYKDANLQLMGAYVIETREHPVDMSGLINSEEGKAFYKKYQDLFLDAKEATGDDKIAKIELFYKAVREDFPITQEVRTEGIAHADDYATLAPYKLSVTPIIAAAEIMFQNYKVDATLNDSEIDFLNDLGLCNYADETFERIETITLTNEEDNKNPLYSQYRDSIIYMLKQDGNYFIDNEHRELTKLDAFQEQVNWNTYGGYWQYSTYTTTDTYTETKTWTETETETREEITREEKPITEEAKEEVDQQIEEENEEARKEAEEEAEETRQEMQEEADKEAAEIEEEVKRDEEDLQENIDDANEQITQNQDGDPTNDKPVNEDDLGHGVEFDPEHQDGNGNLNDSVENITTDPHGDETGSDFPDPNETGQEFDAAGEAMTYSAFDGEPFTIEESAQQVTETQPRVADQGQQVYEYEEPVSNEKLVEQYVEQLASEQPSEEDTYQYTK